MAIFRSNATTVAKESYADRLGSIKSMFQTAHNKASALYDEMQKEIEAKKAQVTAINEQIKEIGVTQAETNKFMTNLEKFI